MKLYVVCAVLLVALAGCAGYKELEPDPAVSAAERGYIELKQGKENFTLEQGKKYILKFPMPPQNNFYLILVTRAKDTLYSYLSANFEKGKGWVVPIRDETASNKSTMVYAMGRQYPTFTWIIDTVRYDVRLPLKYRYVPQWRYTFENKFVEYQKILASNVVDRSTFNSISAGYDVDHLDIDHELTFVGDRNSKLKTMKDELQRLEGLFPENIAASKDTAYEKYTAFRKKVDDEWTFQDDYVTILNMFKKEKETRGSLERFIESVPYFANIVNQRNRFPSGVIAKASQVFLGRLSEVTPYIDNILRRKSDAVDITTPFSLASVSPMYQACGRPTPEDVETIFQFIARYNAEVDSISPAEMKFGNLQSYFDSHIGSPTESFYADLAAGAREARMAIPEPQASMFRPYGGYGFVNLLSDEILAARIHAEDLLAMYETAGSVASDINAKAWSSAETRLRGLFESRGISKAPEIPNQRSALVKRFESDIFNGIKTATADRIEAFLKSHAMAIDSVTQLYSDPAFHPVYMLTFSSLGPADLVTKRKEIENYLDHIKYYQFPESSIKVIYDELIRNRSERGVEKARAVVEHGKFYRGTDKQVKGLIAECNVEIPKAILKPKEYRKLFALPVTSEKDGTNEYMFRIQLQVPSEAEFPVFDMNLKLPQEVAENSEKEQWYESITIDKKPIKNEGRFRITSPTAENNYETLITPVQMEKNGKNILEVRFKYDGFKVFEVSAMAQVPIIRKN